MNLQVRIRVLRGHSDVVKSCQFCLGDSRLLSASHDGRALMWDVITGQVLNSYSNGHSKYISAARVNAEASRQVVILGYFCYC